MEAKMNKANAQSTAPETSARLIALDFFKEHDTPPPALVMQGTQDISRLHRSQRRSQSSTGNILGSCLIELPDGDLTFDEQANDSGYDGYRKFKLDTKLEKIILAHVKVVDGSGEIQYRLDNDETQCLNIEVELGLKEELPVYLSAEGKYFVISTHESKTLGRRKDATSSEIDPDPSMNSQKRPQRFRCMEADDDKQGEDETYDEYGIETVKVKKGSDTLFRLDLADLKEEGQELKVMVWWEEYTPKPAPEKNQA